MRWFRQAQKSTSEWALQAWRQRHYWLRVLLLIVLGLGAGYLLDEHDALLHFRYELYRWQTNRLFGAGNYAVDTRFVTIDDDTFYGPDFARTRPLKRDALARLVQAISGANPAAIVLDLDLRTPTLNGKPLVYPGEQPDIDALLKTLRDSARGASLIVPMPLEATAVDGAFLKQASLYDSLPVGDSAVKVMRGYTLLDYDLRTIPSCITARDASGGEFHADSMAFAMLHASNEDLYNTLAKPVPGAGCTPRADLDVRFGQFMASGDFRKYAVSAADILHPRAANPRIAAGLEHKVVILCATWHENSYGTGPQVDMHDSPAGEVPGAFLHASYFEALLLGHHFPGLSSLAGDGVEVLSVLIAAGWMLKTQNVRKRLAIAFFPAGVMVICSYLLLQNLGAFFECTIPLIVLVCHVVVDQVLEWRELAHKYSNSSRSPGNTEPAESGQESG